MKKWREGKETIKFKKKKKNNGGQNNHEAGSRPGNYTSIYTDVQNLNNTLNLKSISKTEAHQLSSEYIAVLLQPCFVCSVSFTDALCQHIRKTHSPSLPSEVSC